MHQSGQPGGGINAFAPVLAARTLPGPQLPGSLLGGSCSLPVQRQQHCPPAAAGIQQRPSEPFCECFMLSFSLGSHVSDINLSEGVRP